MLKYIETQVRVIIWAQ